jgi:C4-dicarboxylate-specific signal transduction histidine kinase
MNLLFTDTDYPASSRAHVALFRHMLATPLTTLECLAEVHRSKQQQVDANISQKSIADCFKRIHQILDIFSLQLHKPSTFTVESMLISVKSYLAKNQEQITFHYQSEACKKFKLHCNRFLLEEAFVCLLNNAIESQSQLKQPLVLISVFVKQRQLHISIKDFGCGIPWWHRYFVGKPFISFKPKGTGLGISFAKQVLSEELKGNISIYSNNSFGTEIICSIPLHR